MPMSDAISNCPFGPKRGRCDELLADIKRMVSRNKHEFDGKGTHGLEHRFRELVASLARGDVSRYKTHVDEIIHQQSNLEKALNEFERNGCGPPPRGAWSWATRKIPTPVELGANLDARSLMTGAGVIGGGYLLYRLIRLLPSLLPPAWPTLPANIAIP